jgi:hypothetical protein
MRGDHRPDVRRCPEPLSPACILPNEMPVPDLRPCSKGTDNNLLSCKIFSLEKGFL